MLFVTHGQVDVGERLSFAGVGQLLNLIVAIKEFVDLDRLLRLLLLLLGFYFEQLLKER